MPARNPDQYTSPEGQLTLALDESEDDWDLARDAWPAETGLARAVPIGLNRN